MVSSNGLFLARGVEGFSDLGGRVVGGGGRWRAGPATGFGGLDNGFLSNPCFAFRLDLGGSGGLVSSSLYIISKMSASFSKILPFLSLPEPTQSLSASLFSVACCTKSCLV